MKSSRPTPPRRAGRPTRGSRTSGNKPQGAKSGKTKAGKTTSPSSPRLAARANRAAAKKRRQRATGLRFTTARGTFSISWRAIMLLVTLAFSLAIVASPLQHYLQQREQARQLNAEVAQMKDDIATYEREKARWANPEFVAAQARDRLGWVLPGETPYVVVDPQTVTGEDDPGDARHGVPQLETKPPWYLAVADSVEIASGLKENPDAGN